MRQVLFSLLLFLFASCAAQKPPVPLLDGMSLAGDPVCFGDRQAIPSFFERFYATRDLTTDEGKIEYLLHRISRSKLVFIRNGVEYSSSSSAEFLRWKLDRLRKRHKIKVERVEDFISEVTAGSRMSGEPYAVVIPGSGRHKLQSVLENELEVLNMCLKEAKAKEEAELVVPKEEIEEDLRELDQIEQ